MMRSIFLLSCLALTVLGACENKARPQEPFEKTVELPSCSAVLRLEPPASMKELRIAVEPTRCERQPSAMRIQADMPGMPMNLAPIDLKRAGDGWTGTITFTMSGPWYIELYATQETQTTVRRYDLTVP